jgi:GNAT superfamily N-acetyltransferase
MRKISITSSRRISNYKVILEELVDEFGYDYYPSILAWCNVIKDDSDPSLYWNLYLIKYNNKPVGICGFYSHYSFTVDELWLAYFGVIPKYRNKKIGGFAMEWMKRKAKKLGCQSLMAYMNHDQENSPLEFYKRHGFKKLDTVKQYLTKHPELDMSYFDNPKHFVIQCNLS